MRAQAAWATVGCRPTPACASARVRTWERGRASADAITMRMHAIHAYGDEMGAGEETRFGRCSGADAVACPV